MLLADAYVAVGRSEEAASLIREHIKQTPQDSQSYLVLGVIYNLAYIYSEKLNNLDRAGELARKAHELAQPNRASKIPLVGYCIVKANTRRRRSY
ncbi:MAG: hypothetical protein DME32_04135 [Verrucomicrobia bacterium]|nr:MAG: hypothetical protein DME32_04135 [Verrucomicrobiota bacterium]